MGRDASCASGEHAFLAPGEIAPRNTIHTRGLDLFQLPFGIYAWWSSEYLRVIGNDAVGHFGMGLMPLSMMCWWIRFLFFFFAMVVISLRTISAVRRSIDPKQLSFFAFFIRFICISVMIACPQRSIAYSYDYHAG